MRSVPFPDLPQDADGFVDDDAADAFYNDQTASGDCRNAYECLVAVDRLLQKRGLELLMYEGDSDHRFEIVDFQAPVPMTVAKRVRGPSEITIEESIENVIRTGKQNRIRAAYDYNAAARNMASCNALYMGSMATCSLFNALGSQWPGDLNAAIERASDKQLDAGLVVCANILDVIDREAKSKA